MSVFGRKGRCAEKKSFLRLFRFSRNEQLSFPRAVSEPQRVATKWHFIISRRLWWFPPPRWVLFDAFSVLNGRCFYPSCYSALRDSRRYKNTNMVGLCWEGKHVLSGVKRQQRVFNRMLTVMFTYLRKTEKGEETSKRVFFKVGFSRPVNDCWHNSKYVSHQTTCWKSGSLRLHRAAIHYLTWCSWRMLISTYKK